MADAGDEPFQVFHYKDRDKREIDFLIENSQGHLLGIEVKAGSALSHNSFKHLLWFRQNMAKHNNFTGIILYTGKMDCLLAIICGQCQLQRCGVNIASYFCNQIKML